MKKTLKKWRNSVRKRASGSSVALVLTGLLLVVGVPPHLAAPAGDIGAEIYETMKGKGDGEES